MLMPRSLAETAETASSGVGERESKGYTQGYRCPQGAGARHRPVARRRTAKGGPMDESLLISVDDVDTARDRASKSMTDNDGND
jgi:hypothetical protein